MKLSLIICILIFITSSCSLTGGSDLKRRSIENYYLSNGNKDYKLPKLPYWANFSSAGKCRLDRNVTYFDLNSLRNSLNLDYEQAVQTQLMYNDSLFRLENKKSIDSITLEVQEKFFLEVNQKIQRGIRVFNKPKYLNVSVIWVDHFLKKRGELKDILSNELVKEGHPVLLSFCYSRVGLEKFLEEDGLDRTNARLITTEMMNPYTPNKLFDYDFTIHLQEHFLKEHKITIFGKRGSKIPSQIKGKFIKKYL